MKVPRAALIVFSCGMACRENLDTKPSPSPPAAKASSATSIWAETFAAFPGARRLCSQHVVGKPMHVEWTAYATERPTADVVAFYEEHRGTASVERDDAAGVSLRSGRDLLLSVFPKGARHPTCDVAPASQDLTVIVVSQAIRPGR